MNHQLELDVLNELGLELSSHYIQLFSIVRWVIELGISIFIMRCCCSIKQIQG
jgi:hypothetical protein